MSDKKAKDTHPVESFVREVVGDMDYNSEALSPKDRYVGWLDIMGSGQLMSTSLQKTANSLARLHIAIELAKRITKLAGDLIPMNDGIFIITPSKLEIMKLLQQTMVFLAARFLTTNAHQDQFLVRGAISYGPVVNGTELATGISRKKLRENSEFIKNVHFGPPIVQAYQTERNAPPFGIAIHESARSFGEPGQRKFQTNLWLWWHDNDDGSRPPNAAPLGDLKLVLAGKVKEYFDWFAMAKVFNELSESKITEYRQAAAQYLAAK